ncbi:unnamed protein product, partial [Mycena citricolor]
MSGVRSGSSMQVSYVAGVARVSVIDLPGSDGLALRVGAGLGFLRAGILSALLFVEPQRDCCFIQLRTQVDDSLSLLTAFFTCALVSEFECRSSI